MTVDVGTVAYIKTTEEPVFVLRVLENEERGSLMPDQPRVTVRRPVAGRDGVQHVVADFYQCELESAESRALRQPRYNSLMDLIGENGVIVEGADDTKAAN